MEGEAVELEWDSYWDWRHTPATPHQHSGRVDLEWDYYMSHDPHHASSVAAETTVYNDVTCSDTGSVSVCVSIDSDSCDEELDAGREVTPQSSYESCRIFWSAQSSDSHLAVHKKASSFEDLSLYTRLVLRKVRQRGYNISINQDFSFGDDLPPSPRCLDKAFEQPWCRFQKETSMNSTIPDHNSPQRTWFRHRPMTPESGSAFRQDLTTSYCSQRGDTPSDSDSEIWDDPPQGYTDVVMDTDDFSDYETAVSSLSFNTDLSSLSFLEDHSELFSSLSFTGSYLDPDDHEIRQHTIKSERPGWEDPGVWVQKYYITAFPPENVDDGNVDHKGSANPRKFDPNVTLDNAINESWPNEVFESETEEESSVDTSRTVSPGAEGSANFAEAGPDPGMREAKTTCQSPQSMGEVVAEANEITVKAYVQKVTDTAVAKETQNYELLKDPDVQKVEDSSTLVYDKDAPPHSPLDSAQAMGNTCMDHRTVSKDIDTGVFVTSDDIREELCDLDYSRKQHEDPDSAMRNTCNDMESESTRAFVTTENTGQEICDSNNVAETHIGDVDSLGDMVKGYVSSIVYLAQATAEKQATDECQHEVKSAKEGENTLYHQQSVNEDESCHVKSVQEEETPAENTIRSSNEDAADSSTSDSSAVAARISEGLPATASPTQTTLEIMEMWKEKHRCTPMKQEAADQSQHVVAGYGLHSEESGENQEEKYHDRMKALFNGWQERCERIGQSLLEQGYIVPPDVSGQNDYLDEVSEDRTAVLENLESSMDSKGRSPGSQQPPDEGGPTMEAKLSLIGETSSVFGNQPGSCPGQDIPQFNIITIKPDEEIVTEAVNEVDSKESIESNGATKYTFMDIGMVHYEPEVAAECGAGVCGGTEALRGLEEAWPSAPDTTQVTVTSGTYPLMKSAEFRTSCSPEQTTELQGARLVRQRTEKMCYHDFYDPTEGSYMEDAKASLLGNLDTVQEKKPATNHRELTGFEDIFMTSIVTKIDLGKFEG